MASVTVAQRLAYSSSEATLAATAAVSVPSSTMQALPSGLTVAQATDNLWYFLGNASYFTLTDDLHWPLSQASDWIYQQLLRTLLDQDCSSMSRQESEETGERG